MIRWFTENGVAANLIAIIAIVAGLVVATTIKLELFPDFEIDTVQITVAYPGASPEEVETGILELIENRLLDVEGIQRLTSVANEGIGQVFAEIRRGFSLQETTERIRGRVDGIDNFPVEAERPLVESILIQSEVISLAIQGPEDEASLREAAEWVRDALERRAGISQTRLSGVRSPELVIELSAAALERYGLAFEDVAEAVRRSSIDLPGGTIRADAGDLLLRTPGRAMDRDAFERLPLITRPGGAVLRLGDVAKIVDGFTDDPLFTRFDGRPAAVLQIFAVGDEGILEVAKRVYAFAAEIEEELPASVAVEPFRDLSFYLGGRLAMLIQNGIIGLVLVFAVLTVFLRPSLAFFVMLGIPIAFLGSIILLPPLGVTINLASLFGFILVLGIVVDDAIIVGESVFTEAQRRGGSGVDASFEGARRVAVPVTFAILTSIVAFAPILTLPGFLGKFFYPIPVVVIVCLIWSLIQAKLVLPYHLTLCRIRLADEETGLHPILAAQRKVAKGLEQFIERVYHPFLKLCLEFRYTTVAAFTALLILSLGVIAGERLRFVFFPNVPSDFIVARVNLPEGAPVAATVAAIARMEAALDALEAEVAAEGLGNPFQHRLVTIGDQPFEGGPGPRIGSAAGRANRAEIALELTKSEDRVGGGTEATLSAPILADRWRELMGPLPGVRAVQLSANAAAGPGAALDIQLTGSDLDQLRTAAAQVRDALGGFAGLFNLSDGASETVEELNIALTVEGEAMGIRLADIAAQVRAAFFGREVQRFQRGRNDVRVIVRSPASERYALAQLENLRIRLPDGTAAPLHLIATIERGASPSSITRIDRRRAINVTADADKDTVDLRRIRRALAGGPQDEPGMMAEILADFPDVEWSFQGEAQEQEDINRTLGRNALLAFLIIYGLLAIAFRSYVQPLLVMFVIPFGLIGAIAGHAIMGHPLSVLSLLGFVALAGVVVNDSLVLVDYINRERRAGTPIRQAVLQSGSARFRAILLTSLTTFAGLLPLLFETSLQAQFLIPMAISLSFGVLFATVLTLLLVPAAYYILEDFGDWMKRFTKSG